MTETWIDYPHSPFNIVWHHPAGWRATICLTQIGQFSAILWHVDQGASFAYDSELIEPADAYQFEQLSRQSLARFDAWIVEQGPETLDELPVIFELQRKHLRPLLEQISNWKALAEVSGWEAMPLRAALVALNAELERRQAEFS